MATINGPIYEVASQAYNLVAASGTGYVPVSLLYGSSSSGTTSTPPTVSVTTPTSGATVSGTSVSLAASAAAGSGLSIAKVQFQVDGTNLGGSLTSAPYSTTFDSTALSNGSHTLTAIAVDSSGVSTTSAGVAVTVSNSSSTGSGGSGTTTTALISGFNPGNARNDYTGWVGMQFTVGSTAISVASLGRVYIAGNTGTHTVKLVQANGVDVAGGSAQVVLPGGTTAGQFAYGQLASAVTLAANTSYYLVSQETYGSDQWYNIGSVTGGSAASIGGPVYYSGSSYVVVGGYGSQSYVPVNLKYTSGSSGTTTPPTSGTALVTGSNPGAARNDYNGWVGMAFAVGSSPVTVSSLGRVYVAGNSGTHVVKLVQSNGTDVAGGTVQVVLPGGGTAGQFTYVQLPSAVTLAANTTYYLVSQETYGGDQWHNIGSVVTTSVANVLGPVYYSGSSYVVVGGYGSQSYVPVSLLYQ